MLSRVRGGSVSRLAASQDGAALILFTIMLPVLMALVAMSVDFGRYWMLNTELQDLADAKALAAAKKLDGSPDAIPNARAAAQAVNNDPKFAQLALGADEDEIAEYVFFGEDDIKIAPELRTPLADDESALAVFVTVRTRPRTMFGSFIAAVADDLDQETAASATAGTQYVACQLTPLRICWSPPSEFEATRGQQFRLRQNGNGSGVNGDFAIVDPPNQTNGNITAINLGSPSPNFCFISANTVTPGNKVSQVAAGMNVRFDMYSNGQSSSTLATFPPAPNVRKGLSGGNACSNNPQLNGVKLPRDADLIADLAKWRGNGDWKGGLPAYIAAHHANRSQAFKDQLTAIANRTDPPGTRWEIYLAELGLTEATAGTLIPRTQTMPIGSPSGENPNPQCYSGSAANLDPKRRIIYVAIVDCSDNSGNSTPPRRSTKYAKFFMTEPVTPPSQNNELYAEFLEYVTPGDESGVLHQIVQLYE